MGKSRPPTHIKSMGLDPSAGQQVTVIETIEKIIREGSIRTMFQPIINIREKRVIGLEALSRGIDSDSGKIIPPLEMFDAAARLNKNLELDRLCRAKAVDNFIALAPAENHLLFLNFDPAVLSKVDIGECWMQNRVTASGLDCGNAAIEIVESKVESSDDLVRFTELYREHGFIIVLDDFGAEHSNLDRILLLKPDIIKLDRRLVDHISQDHYKQAVVKSIADLALKTGSLCLAEGVERLEDVLKCYEIGIDLFQGYFFSRPFPSDRSTIPDLSPFITSISEESGGYLNTIVAEQEEQNRIYKGISAQLCGELKGSGFKNIDDALDHCIKSHEDIQCAYLLNSSGRQVSVTACNLYALYKKRHALYKPSEKGADLSLKEYFHTLVSFNLEYYITEPYISLATGSLCRTTAMVFRASEKQFNVLCIDFDICSERSIYSGDKAVSG